MAWLGLGDLEGEAPGTRFGEPPVGLRQVGVVLGGLDPPPNRLLILLPRLSLRGFSTTGAAMAAAVAMLLPSSTGSWKADVAAL